MKNHEKLAYLKDNHFQLFLTTRREVFNELSDSQTTFCCCGRLATGLHESHCIRFNNKVNAETIKRLKHLLPSKSGK